VFDATAIVTGCIKSGAGVLLIDEPALPPEFFNESRGQVGELLHRPSIYRMFLPRVVTETQALSIPLRDFVREANRGGQYRFFPTRDGPEVWLESPREAADQA
jgi:hypothetical protein